MFPASSATQSVVYQSCALPLLVLALVNMMTEGGCQRCLRMADYSLAEWLNISIGDCLNGMSASKAVEHICIRLGERISNQSVPCHWGILRVGSAFTTTIYSFADFWRPPAVTARNIIKPRRTGPNWTGYMSASSALAVVQPAPATGGTRTSTLALLSFCKPTGAHRNIFFNICCLHGME